MIESDKKILDIYMRGFNHELDGKPIEPQVSKLLTRSYCLGRLDAIVGDECDDIDMRTNKEIVDSIKK